MRQTSFFCVDFYIFFVPFCASFWHLGFSCFAFVLRKLQTRLHFFLALNHNILVANYA